MGGCLSRVPTWGPGPQPRHVPWLGIEPATLVFTGQQSINWATPVRAESRREGQREGEKHQLVASCISPTRGLAYNPGLCPDWELNQWPFGRRLALNPMSHTSQGLNHICIIITPYSLPGETDIILLVMNYGYHFFCWYMTLKMGHADHTNRSVREFWGQMGRSLVSDWLDIKVSMNSGWVNLSAIQ